MLMPAQELKESESGKKLMCTCSPVYNLKLLTVYNLVQFGDEGEGTTYRILQKIIGGASFLWDCETRKSLKMRSLSLPQDRTCYLYENKVSNSGTPRDGSKPMASPMKLVSSRRASILHHFYGRTVTHILCFLSF